MSDPEQIPISRLTPEQVNRLLAGLGINAEVESPAPPQQVVTIDLRQA